MVRKGGGRGARGRAGAGGGGGGCQRTTDVVRMLRVLFLFSSRRRHTRFSRDWSSDVCSSDLRHPNCVPRGAARSGARRGRGCGQFGWRASAAAGRPRCRSWRSEERRVGAECRRRWWQDGEGEKWCGRGEGAGREGGRGRGGGGAGASGRRTSCGCFGSCFCFRAEDGIRDFHVTGVQTCALPIFATRTACPGVPRGRGHGVVGGAGSSGGERRPRLGARVAGA